jgi:hypothetical protein
MSIRLLVLAVSSVVTLSSCSHLERGAAAGQPAASDLVGAWEVTATRAGGVGKNLLTFSSDGTFFRSGDTHPVLSGAHGAWKLAGPHRYQASYVAFSFDKSGKWSGVTRNNLQIDLDPDGNSFHGMAKISNRDLQENVVGAGEVALTGRRIQVQPY